jgi:hypothetical protein
LDNEEGRDTVRLPTTLLMTAAALALAAGPALAAKPTKSRLECRIVFGPGAAGAVRYEVDGRRKRFQARVEVQEEDEGATAVPPLADVPLYAEGDVLPVSTGNAPAYAVGTITLRLDEDRLEGALKLESRGRGGAVFPPDFPKLAAGTSVTIDGRSCTLQERRRPR